MNEGLVFVLITTVIAITALLYVMRCRHDYRVIDKIETPSVLDTLKKAGAYEFSGLRHSDCIRTTKVIVSCSKCGKLHTITNES